MSLQEQGRARNDALSQGREGGFGQLKQQGQKSDQLRGGLGAVHEAHAEPQQVHHQSLDVERARTVVAHVRDGHLEVLRDRGPQVQGRSGRHGARGDRRGTGDGRMRLLLILRLLRRWRRGG